MKLSTAILMTLLDAMKVFLECLLALIAATYLVSLIMFPMVFVLFWTDSGRLGPLWAILYAAPVLVYIGGYFVEEINKRRKTTS